MNHNFTPNTAEHKRLLEDSKREKNWKRWGPYLSERQWGTVREDYSHNSESWHSFPHDHARKRTYRWGEDGLLGITDRQCRLAFSLALWNGKDPYLKERLFGLTGPEGNHGEDVKELYYYLDSTPSHSWMKALYKYPNQSYPYKQLVKENQSRGLLDPEYEINDTGLFTNEEYFDVFAEYAKADDNDILINIRIANRSTQNQSIAVIPQLWFRNTWIWGCEHEGCTLKPQIKESASNEWSLSHETLGDFFFYWDKENNNQTAPETLFTENETNTKDLYGSDNYTPYTKDAFHRYIVDQDTDAINPNKTGTKAGLLYHLSIEPQDSVVLQLRLSGKKLSSKEAFGKKFGEIFEKRKEEADQFYDSTIPKHLSTEQKSISRQASAGMLWSKQFYHYSVKDWLNGDPNMPSPPEERKQGRNNEWNHLFNRDILSMPDKWEYPWFAAWDSAFHMIPFAHLDPYFTKDQLTLFLREWYMHPNGQIPAYEFNFSDVNPPVHAWSCWRTYKMTGPKGKRDISFLARTFHKLMLNFTWWVNRKDPDGSNLFSGGFLGLDNIGVFDRSKPLPNGGELQQADGTSWMAFYCTCMLSIAMELAEHDPSYEDVASKFFEHFVGIAEAMNNLGGTGLWNEDEGFYYDQLLINGDRIPMKVKSMVGLIPLFAVSILDSEKLKRLPGFKKRMEWFLNNKKDSGHGIAYNECANQNKALQLLCIPTEEKLKRVLNTMLDENEFLSPFGIRSLSKKHENNPYHFHCGSETYTVDYVPGESNSWLFGGNSNWRGPIWFPVNYLIIESLESYHFYYQDSLKVECPTGSGNFMNLKEVAAFIAKRLIRLFTKNEEGNVPSHGNDPLYKDNQHFEGLTLFYEYFDGDTGRGCGASHQTGWTGLIIKLIEKYGENSNN